MPEPSTVADQSQATVLESDLNSTIDHTAFSVRIDLAERRHLVWREDHLAETSLASVGDVFEVQEKAVLAERLFSEDSQSPKRFGPEAVTQKLPTRVIRFKSGLVVRFLFKQQRRVDPACRSQRQSLIANQI